MTIKFYYTLISAPARASLFVLKTLNIRHELHKVDLMKGGTLEANFVKINPQHTVPTLQDDDLVLWDSHAINAYLANQYGENDLLYSKNPKKRAIIDQRLHFDTGVLFPCVRNVTRAVRGRKLSSVSEEIRNVFEEGYDFVEKFLQNNKYAAGDDITIADYSFVTSLTTMNCLVPIETKKYPTLIKYLELCRSTLEYYEEVNEEGIQQYRDVLKKYNFQFES